VLTTLYCDASFCPHQLVGGWAIWLRSEQGRIVEDGATPDYCTQSYEAELAAIYAGIYRTSKRWPGTTAILVRSDCQTALELMDRKYRARSRSAHRLTTKIHQLQAQQGFRLISRWVKGHQRGSQTDAWLNNKVDELARKVMETERLKAQENTGHESP
jgi:ribonuclease HI